MDASDISIFHYIVFAFRQLHGSFEVPSRDWFCRRWVMDMLQPEHGGEITRNDDIRTVRRTGNNGYKVLSTRDERRRYCSRIVTARQVTSDRLKLPIDLGNG